MAIQKINLLFNQVNGDTTRGRACGWSETWYVDSTLTGAQALGAALAKKRASFLTRSGQIIGQRIHQIGGAAIFAAFTEVGQLGTDSDIPQMALNVSMKCLTQPYGKSMQLRGIPDARVQFGEYNPSQAFQGAFQQWALALQGNSIRIQAIDRAAARVKIFSIDATGAVACAAGATFAVGDTVIIRNCRDTNGNNVNGRYFIETRTDDQHIKLRGWGGSVVGVKGTIAKLGYTYPLIDGQTVQIIAATTRKVGRPFFGFRGRATRR